MQRNVLKRSSAAESKKTWKSEVASPWIRDFI